MDLYNAPWDLGALGLASPLFNENALDFSSLSIQSSLPGLEELNANHGETDVFADWMDEKMDLSLLDGMEGQPDILDDLDVMIGDPVALLNNLIDWSSELLKNENDVTDTNKNDFLEQNMLQVGLSPPVSPGNKVPDITFGVLPDLRQDSFYQQVSNGGSSLNTITIAAPDTKFKEAKDLNPIDSEMADDYIPSDFVKVELGSPETILDNFTSSSPPLTPASFVSSANEYLTVDSHSPASTELSSCVTSTPPLSPVSFVPSVESIENSLEVETDVSTIMPHSLTSFVLDSSFNNNSSNNESQELSTSVKECNSGGTSLHGEVDADKKSGVRIKRCRSRKKAGPIFNSPVPVDVRRKERKRVQNKDAATRYREKKRKESKAVVNEELVLEMRNKELHNTVDKLRSEISYLKGLMKEAKLRAQSRQNISPVKV